MPREVTIVSLIFMALGALVLAWFGYTFWPRVQTLTGNDILIREGYQILPFESVQSPNPERDLDLRYEVFLEMLRSDCQYQMSDNHLVLLSFGSIDYEGEQSQYLPTNEFWVEPPPEFLVRLEHTGVNFGTHQDLRFEVSERLRKYHVVGSPKSPSFVSIFVEWINEQRAVVSYSLSDRKGSYQGKLFIGFQFRNGRWHREREGNEFSN